MARPRKTPELPATDEQTPAELPATVRMVRDAAEYPKPHTADVHPDEVQSYAAGGWRVE